MMTPAQQSALEAIAGRGLTADEMAAIEPHLASRNDGAIAALLPAAVNVVSTPIGVGTILAVMAPRGGLFIAGLRQMGATQPPTIDSANVAEVVGLIERGEFDIGHPVTREQLSDFAQANPELGPAISALLAVAERTEPVSINAVSEALNRIN